MELKKKPVLEASIIDEGELSSSLADLSRPPRLRGNFSLGLNRLSGWLVDARAPTAPLQLSLFVDDRKVAAVVRAMQPRPMTTSPSSFHFSLSWAEEIDYSGAIILEVICFDGDKYQLLISSDKPGSLPRDTRSPASEDLVFKDETKRGSVAAKDEVEPPNVIGKNAPPIVVFEEGASQTPAGDRASGFRAANELAEGPTSRPAIRAYIDSFRPDRVSGWAWDEHDPQATVQIIAYEKQKPIAYGLANNLRPDLKDAGVGTGRYGFTLSLPACNPEDLSMEAQLGSVTEIVSIPAQVQRLSQMAGSPSTKAREPAHEGHVDRLTRWGAVGWAWLPQQPLESVIVEAVHEGEVLGRAVANRMREDLATHGKGTGRYGFELSFDRLVQGDDPPEFRIMAPTQGILPNSHQLPAIAEKERTIRGRGGLEDLYAEHAKFTSAGDAFEEFKPSILERVDRSGLDIIAFYLPQFHSIKENDSFWGRGFTEWRQLARGLPRYRGHYQPRTPRDLGFYTLTDIEPMTRQAAMAKSAGVNVFAFYYYWFNRTRILDEPVEIFLRSGLEIKFMLIWANENWTRTWDGSESEVLLKQDYSEGDEQALLADWVRHFQDNRYYTIDGRPLFVIYNPKLIPQPKTTIARWRRILETKYDINPLMFMAQTFGMRDPGEFGLDGAIEFPPHKLSDSLPGRPTPDAYSPEFSGRVIEYDEFVRVSLAEEMPAYPLIKTAVPSWDNEARRPNRGFSLELASPDKYQRWIANLVGRALSGPRIGGRSGRAIVAVNAWNEWAEGAYLEPDVHFGAAYLNATARAIKAGLAASTATTPRILSKLAPAVTVIFPCYNHEKFLAERITSVLEQTMKPAEIIFLDDCSSDNSIEVARGLLEKSDIPYKIILNRENSGNVFKQWVKGLREASSDWIWIAETDDSVDRKFLESLSTLLSREDILAAFGKISFIDTSGKKLKDLAGYFDGLRLFDWNRSAVVSAFNAFAYDFTVKNIIPNASGLVFRRPVLTKAQTERLFQYKFAGDWYFYALLLRGGKVGYCRDAQSYFRVSQDSASRSNFVTDRHLTEHQMIIDDLRKLYDITDEAVAAHAEALTKHFPGKAAEEINKLFKRKPARTPGNGPLRICIAAHSFEIGGGELQPLALANKLRELDHHVTYLVMERTSGLSDLRSRLRPDISVVYWEDIQDQFDGFLEEHGIQIFNSHNVSVEYKLFCHGIKVGRPYIASLHGGYETVVNLLKGPFARYLSENVSRWLFLAEKNVKVLTDHGLDQGLFVKSFNAVPEFVGPFETRDAFVAEYDISPNAFIFVQCSRAIKEKGWRESIVAIQKAEANIRRPVHLVLIGDGPELPELKQSFGDEKRVTFMGHVNNPVRYFRCFDAAIFPSYFKGETFPLFLLECFQHGLPVIASRIGQIPELFTVSGGAQPGRLIELRGGAPDFSSLVKSIVQLANDEDILSGMKAAAQSVGARFEIGKLAKFYEAFFHETLQMQKEESSSRIQPTTG